MLGPKCGRIGALHAAIVSSTNAKAWYPAADFGVGRAFGLRINSRQLGAPGVCLERTSLDDALIGRICQLFGTGSADGRP